MARDDFSEKTKLALSQRAGLTCSNPTCRDRTTFSHSDADDWISVGVAAHITAASAGTAEKPGPRYDSRLTSKQRSSADNGIWLCQTCSRLIDQDVKQFPTELLQEWKVQHDKYLRDPHAQTKAAMEIVSQMYETRLKEGPADWIEKAKNGFSNQYFRVEIATGKGALFAFKNAIASQALNDPDSDDCVAVHLYEKFPGALKEHPIGFGMTLEFPDTAEGQAAFKQYRELYELGNPVVLDSDYIKNFRTTMPDFFGKGHSYKSIKILVTPNLPDKILPCRVKILGENDVVIAELGYVLMKLHRVGTKQFLLSNESQNVPLEIEMGETKSGPKLGFNFKPAGHKVSSLPIYLKFLESLSCGKSISIELLETGDRVALGTIDGIDLSQINKVAATCKEIYTLSKSLQLEFSFPPIEKISVEDMLIIDRILNTLYATGTEESTITSISMRINTEAAQKLSQMPDLPGTMLAITLGPELISLFDNTVQIDLGNYNTILPGSVFNGLDLQVMSHSATSNGDQWVQIDNSFEDPGITIRRNYLRFSSEPWAGLSSPPPAEEPI